MLSDSEIYYPCVLGNSLWNLRRDVGIILRILNIGIWLEVDSYIHVPPGFMPG
jgi:hypothetical protein